MAGVRRTLSVVSPTVMVSPDLSATGVSCATRLLQAVVGAGARWCVWYTVGGYRRAHTHTHPLW